MPEIKNSSSIEEVLKYIVDSYGAEIYQDKQRLSNLIADLYTGEERLKRLYRRMIMEDSVSQQLYSISLKPIQERENFYNQLLFQFQEANFLEESFARQSLEVFVRGLHLLLKEPVSTNATEEDGEWFDEYGVKYSADRKKLIRAPKILYGNYSVLDGTVVICDFAFEGCKNLYEITLPVGIMSIGANAFWYCENMLVISLPSSVISIGNGAFSNCENLPEILLPSSVVNIGEGGFRFCSNLREITIPSSVMIIGEYAFDGCWNLCEIKVAENNTTYSNIDGVLYTKDLKTIICYPAGKMNENFILPTEVMNIGESCFDSCINLHEITLSSSVTSIGEGAFRFCENLRKITLPLGVTNIGANAFFGCRSLCEITLPPTVMSVGETAFWHCENLLVITLSSGITGIEADSFLCCFNLQQINIPVGTFEKFKELLPGYSHLLNETDM